MKKLRLTCLSLALALCLSACSASSPDSISTTAAHDGWGTQPPSTTGAATVAPAYPGESYLVIRENEVKSTATDSMLTFSLKVDTAAYSNVSRYIKAGQLPPADAVRTEELVNYFTYDTPMAFSPDHPFALYTEIGPSPVNDDRCMAFIRVKSREIDRADLPASSLIFLIDTSGSMNSHDKLPLLQKAFALLVDSLGEDDQVGIVTYAGSAGVVLEPTADREAILSAIETLRPGGSTAGADGINSAYALAEEYFLEGGNNRIILATDGDFNVGPASNKALSALVSEKRESGIYLSILGFGTGNIRDDLMETLSRDGSGNYAYIDSLDTARKVLVDELGANLYTIADDVKAQVEFNPANVKSYRLIGYENRQLSNEDFADDTKDAGEVGAGTDMVLLFEFEPADAARAASGMKYTSGGQGLAEPANSDDPYANELFEVRLRYKEPGQSESRLMVEPVTFDRYSPDSSTDYGFACAVAAFGDLLRGSAFGGGLTADDVLAMAKANLGTDEKGYRLDFVLTLGEYRSLTR